MKPPAPQAAETCTWNSGSILRDPLDGGHWLWRVGDHVIVIAHRRFHLAPPGRPHLAPPDDRGDALNWPRLGFLAASSWPSLTAGQGRTFSLRCGRSTLTCGSSSAIGQQSRKATL
jgi:hypothetical protein